eukprot:jgi/Chlat1/7937/Chrsp68S07388
MVRAPLRLHVAPLLLPVALVLLRLACDAPVASARPLLAEVRPAALANNNTAGVFDRDAFNDGFPLNISGTYRGEWEKISTNTTACTPALLPAAEGKGNAIFQLSSHPTKAEGMQFVQGELVLRNGFYRSDDDLHMTLEGVYSSSLHQLRVMLDCAAKSDAVKPNGEDMQQAINAGASIFWDSKLTEETEAQVDTACDQCKFTMNMQLEVVQHAGNSGLHIAMHGDVESSSIMLLKLDASLIQLETYYNKAINYTLMVSFIQVLCLIRQIEYSNTQAGAAKVSLLMIGQQAIMDAYLCLLHLTAGIVFEPLFNAFATASFFKFVIFSIFEMRFLLAIWKARRPSNFDGWGNMRRELSILYSRFYFFLLFGIMVMYHMNSVMHYLLFFFYSFWVPQIVCSVQMDSRKPLHPQYIFGISVTRLCIPLYMYACPHNIPEIKPNPAYCALLIGWMALQASILLLQHLLGARFFIPKRFLPQKYDYFRKVDKGALPPMNSGEDGGSHMDCVICMTQVDVMRASRRMVTPCDHFFHTDCLQRWMDIKMECPTCRRSLPAM